MQYPVVQRANSVVQQSLGIAQATVDESKAIYEQRKRSVADSTVPSNGVASTASPADTATPVQMSAMPVD
jgi:hypothetical protein